jgi:hypothetical protein
VTSCDIETRCVVDLPASGAALDLAGSAGDGGFVYSACAPARRLRPGLLMRHVAAESANGWWTVTRVNGLGVHHPYSVGVQLVDCSLNLPRTSPSVGSVGLRSMRLLNV